MACLLLSFFAQSYSIIAHPFCSFFTDRGMKVSVSRTPGKWSFSWCTVLLGQIMTTAHGIKISGRSCLKPGNLGLLWASRCFSPALIRRITIGGLSNCVWEYMVGRMRSFCSYRWASQPDTGVYLERSHGKRKLGWPMAYKMETIPENTRFNPMKTGGGRDKGHCDTM